MTIFKLAMAGLLAGAAVAAPARAADLFVFGDSLVDTGNAAAALRATGQPSRTPEAAGYFQDRFTNGYTFADVVSQGLGQGPSEAYGFLPGGPAYVFGGDNFSFGGAQTRSTPGNVTSFASQLGYFAASGKRIDADDVVLVTFGGNDIQQELLRRAGDPSYRPDFTATNAALRDGLNALVAAGARNIIVTGEADVGQIPRITELGSTDLNRLGTALSEQLNASFRTETGTIASRTGYNIQFFDFLSFQRDLLSNAAANGFTNTTQPCLNEATGVRASADCAGYLYFDRIHPTAAAHQRIGSAILTQLGAVPEPRSWAMMILGFGAVGIALRGRGRRRVSVAFA